jgi:methyl-accepting chemotaxis protein
MNLLSRMLVGTKLGAAFAVILTLMVTVGVFSIVQLSNVNAQSTVIVQDWMPSSGAALKIGRQVSNFRTREYRLMTVPAADRTAAFTTLADGQKAVEDSLAVYEKLVSSDKERAIYGDLKKQWVDYLKVSQDMQAAMKAGSEDVAFKLIAKDSLPMFNALSKSMDDLVALNDEGARVASEKADATYATGRMLIIGMMIGSVCIGAVFAVIITRMITRPLVSAVRVARAVADGDLTQEVNSQGHDELAQLLQAQAAMVTKLRGIVSEVRSGVESVSTASVQIANGNHDLSARTEQTASSLQQTASSMEQLTGTVSQSADTASQANQIASSAASAATRGGEVVSQVVTSMQQISGSSKKIADIIGVVDGIAFQTNILALNAAVEAARAGELGRGFAVVASEVRSLAQRSADAAKEIKVLIGTSVETVESGSRQVEEAGIAMTEIVAGVRRVTDLMAEIAAAAAEQRDGIGQVNNAVSDLDQMTQQNAALVEESAAAAGSLRDQAQRLSEVVSVFNVGH